jgi:2-oxo-3-hexenedioate decarboxylase
VSDRRLIADWADKVLAAQDQGHLLAPLTDAWKDIDVETAYAIQDAVLERRLGRGERLVGIKLGLTSHAKQERMGITSPLMAWLTDAMIMLPGERVPTSAVQPRVEPEIAFLMGDELAGPGVTSAHALAAVARVLGAIELLDSRFEGYKFQLPDVVADNASTCGVMLGSVQQTSVDFDLTLAACLFWVDGRAEDSATGAAIQGHPAAALAAAANELASRGRSIEANWIVLTGGLTDAVPLEEGSWVRADFAQLGSIVLARSAP